MLLLSARRVPATGKIFLLAAFLGALLSACGFHLRGAFAIPYERLCILSPGANSELGMNLRRQIRAHRPDTLVESPKEADAVFRQVSDQRERIITVLNADGRAREYQIRLTYTFRVEDSNGNALTPAARITLTRDLTYDDNQVLSKADEENFLWQDMERDLVQQILRRLATLRPAAAPVPEENPASDAPPGKAEKESA
ncbi:MAG: LPS assembly lipoprotein LptE [Zoogloeaceae bacterium]|jgi:LPS-assembly lipoprotein|nr:LPS assembly lipoprotein LptE [Zoogloeaceae bacterium]